MNHTTTKAAGATSSAYRGILRPALSSAVFFMVVTGIAYPLVTTEVAQALFPGQAQGSLIKQDGRPLGSRLVGQSFIRPEYFHGRPSVTLGADPAKPARMTGQPYNAAASNASNLGALNNTLLTDVAARAAAYRRENGLPATAIVPVDAVTASASGLDPDISPANARLQVARVAKARALPEREVLALMQRHVAARQIGVLGEPRINVLELNIALDEAWPSTRAPH
ncbi:potassium-transporting ATPase subunit KdpC [Castellaniella sp.]|uniref:potassium-transporting ATPase subunit KdpC n=1 Tax=Castellaniella sp. TaxID=1955812 RepID=UPI003C72EEDB